MKRKYTIREWMEKTSQVLEKVSRALEKTFGESAQKRQFQEETRIQMERIEKELKEMQAFYEEEMGLAKMAWETEGGEYTVPMKSEMKILIVSDSHGNNTNLKRAIEKMAGTQDRMIHLGDFQCDPHEIYEMAGCPVDLIRGNCDSSSRGVPLSRVLQIGQYRILIAHGHQYAGGNLTDTLYRVARDNQAQIIMTGHTHIPMVTEREGVYIVNPGSISLPRQDNHRPSYLVMNIDQGRVDFVPVYLG